MASTTMGPTEKRRLIQDKAREWALEHDDPPTVRQLADAVKMPFSTVYYHVGELRKAGHYLKLRGRLGRRCPYCRHELDM